MERRRGLTAQICLLLHGANETDVSLLTGLTQLLFSNCFDVREISVVSRIGLIAQHIGRRLDHVVQVIVVVPSGFKDGFITFS